MANAKSIRTQHIISTDQNGVLSKVQRTSEKATQNNEVYRFSVAVHNKRQAPRHACPAAQQLQQLAAPQQTLALKDRPAEDFLTSNYFAAAGALDTLQLTDDETIRLSITREHESGLLTPKGAVAVLWREGTPQELAEHQHTARLGVALKHIPVDINGEHVWFRAQVSYDSIELEKHGFNAAINWAPMAHAFLPQGPTRSFANHQELFDQAQKHIQQELTRLDITGTSYATFSLKQPKQSPTEKRSPYLSSGPIALQR